MNHFDNDNSMMIDIRLDPVRDGLRTEYQEQENSEKEKTYYPVIGTNGDSRMATKDEAMKILEDLGTDAEYLYPDSEREDFVLIYNRKKKFTAEGDAYFAGSVLALRDDGEKLVPVTAHEIHRILDLMLSRTALFIANGNSFTALELD